jgi:hypothetical protein
MFNYIVEKYSLRFYKYKFSGYEDKPITIEAYNKNEARQKLTYFIQQHPILQNVAVVSESLSLPIFGETTKIIDSVDCVWVGNLTTTGWMDLEKFKQLNYE